MLRALKNINLNCQAAARLISRHSERPLALSERVGLKLHLLICRSCRAYQRSVRFLKRIMLLAGSTMNLSPEAPLSSEARERIRRGLPDR